ncbi:MAG TPA: hypothetical protein VNB29_09415, partial [Chthoniobacterales bacterium]|nr:hypothetical protein [Chthoniobacterales bacterium]
MLSSRLVSLAFVLLISPLVAFGQLKYVAPPDPKKPDYSATPMQDWEKKFADFKFFTYEKEGHVLPFRFHQPDALVPGQKYPLVVFFHGLGERGADNRLQFFRFRDTVAFWEKYPCFVLAAQCFAHTE